MKPWYFKSPKYSNKSCRCGGRGHIHDSIFEAEYCDSLSMLVKAGEIKSFETQVSFDLEVNGQHICRHVVDFLVVTKSGAQEVHECKGFTDHVWPLKYKLFLAIYPSIEYHVIAKDYRYGKSGNNIRRTRRDR